jgi:tRNA modification GTPase
MVAPGPSSYTGDDVVELLVPGGEAILGRIMNGLVREAEGHGTPLRHAGPGEFTARAYLNGRIDLLQAEGIAEAIRAETDSQLRAAHLMSDGGLGSVAGSLVEELTRLTALVEAGIDFTDQEDVVAIANESLVDALDAHLAELDRRLRGAASMERLESVPRVVLAGPPNAGKSSLFNALVGSERTVVAAVEGTTRDVVTEPLRIPTDHGDLEVLLSDLAGFDATDATGTATDPLIEQAMQAHARDAVERADLVVRCTAPGQEPVSLPPDIRCLEVMTKSDLPGARGAGLPVSVRTGSGVDALLTSIAARMGGNSNVLAAGVFALTHRHRETLERTMDAMQQARDLATQAAPETMPPAELIASCLRDALDALGELVGRVTPDQVLEHVFASFCVGK